MVFFRSHKLTRLHCRPARAKIDFPATSPSSQAPSVKSSLYFIAIAASIALLPCSQADEPIRVGVFSVDASPPVGSPLAYDPCKAVELPLTAKGIVILGKAKPIVLLSIDWIGIANDGHKLFREKLAATAGTDSSRVAVHAIHQHDAPVYDQSAYDILEKEGIAEKFLDKKLALDVMDRASKAVEVAIKEAQPVSHLGIGHGIVEKVASNRRIMGPNGKVAAVRYTATKDEKIRNEPVGLIDPELKMISFWNGDKAIAVLTYYATHPQSYYRTGLANPDFPGMARNEREKDTYVPHIHFNGAGGNIGAGKWNDGSPANRPILAARVVAGMKSAWDSTKRTPITANDLGWEVERVALPAGRHLDSKALEAATADKNADATARANAAYDLAWLRRAEKADPFEISCLTLGSARILHMPGELFVEYQLAAQKMRPDLFVAMAAYGDYAPGYIGTAIAYPEGGYETSPRATRVDERSEALLMPVLERLLKK